MFSHLEGTIEENYAATLKSTTFTQCRDQRAENDQDATITKKTLCRIQEFLCPTCISEILQLLDIHNRMEEFLKSLVLLQKACHAEDENTEEPVCTCHLPGNISITTASLGNLGTNLICGCNCEIVLNSNLPDAKLTTYHCKCVVSKCNNCKGRITHSARCCET